MNNTIPFVDKCGQKRRGIRVECQSCGTPFLTRQDQPKQTCSVRCRAASKRNRVKVRCKMCDRETERAPSSLVSKSGFYFCSKVCKDKAQRLDGIPEVHLPHYGTGPEDYRKRFTKNQLVCRRCGYKEFTCAVDIHHVDGDHSNNADGNLMPLCSNCHRGLHFGGWATDQLGPLV